MVALSKLLDKGIGVPRDPVESYQYIKDAAEEENPEALYRLGQEYEKGNIHEPAEAGGGGKKNMKRAI